MGGAWSVVHPVKTSLLGFIEGAGRSAATPGEPDGNTVNGVSQDERGAQRENPQTMRRKGVLKE